MLLVKDLSRWPNTWRKKRAALNIFWQIYRHYGKGPCQTLYFTQKKKKDPACGKAKAY